MRLKSTVTIEGVKPELLLGLIVANSIFALQFNSELVITSLTDGRHKVDSLHYRGQAADIRIRGLADPVAVVTRLKNELDEWFDIVLEADHIHFEYDPKERKTGEKISYA